MKLILNLLQETYPEIDKKVKSVDTNLEGELNTIFKEYDGDFQILGSYYLEALEKYEKEYNIIHALFLDKLKQHNLAIDQILSHLIKARIIEKRLSADLKLRTFLSKIN
ncbi:hypothetical protein ABN763_10080 [Spongiivirga sp. MCCC 1A20706]|uniref:hypothetical protein n=1 Tax=Spongiivirga sp. MCCC 1A20706 TaxID=3160963 RepID=UPI00397781EF